MALAELAILNGKTMIDYAFVIQYIDSPSAPEYVYDLCSVNDNVFRKTQGGGLFCYRAIVKKSDCYFEFSFQCNPLSPNI